MVTLLLAVLVQDPAGVGRVSDDVPEERMGLGFVLPRACGCGVPLRLPFPYKVDRGAEAGSASWLARLRFSFAESRLTDDDIEVRDEASACLRSMGDVARFLGRERLKTCRDPEVRARLQELLKRR